MAWHREVNGVSVVCRHHRMKLSSCDTTEELCRRQNDLETGVQGQGRWMAKTISSISRSVPTTPTLCPYHRYVVNCRIQQHRQQSLKQLTTSTRRSVDLLISPGTQLPAIAFPLLDSHPPPPPPAPSLPSLLQPLPPTRVPVTSSPATWPCDQ